MNLKLIIIACLTFVLGYFLGLNSADSFQDSSFTEVTDLEAKLQKANTLNTQLNNKISRIENRPKTTKQLNADIKSTASMLSVTEDAATGYADTASSQDKYFTLASAYQALENGQMDEATKQFNALLAEASEPSERNEIIDGLLAIHEATYQWIIQEGNHLHGAMWQLFEMQKLRPEGQTVNRAQALSTQILSRANEYLDANNLLSGADYLSSLMHTTNMMAYEVQGMPREDIVAKVKDIEQKPQYKESLYQRASNNLMNGSPLEQNIVFWDFAKLAEIDKENLITDQAFNSQFTEAALVHLRHLKDMNKPGEVKSRLDYIRYAFPHLMKDERVSSFF